MDYKNLVATLVMGIIFGGILAFITDDLTYLFIGLVMGLVFGSTQKNKK